MSAFKLQNINTVNFTTTAGAGGVSMVHTTGGVSVDGVIVATTGVSAGNLRLTSGSITDTSGDISFGNENLSTTGTLGCGVLTASSGSTIGNLTLADGSITDSSGAISFGNENLSTTGGVSFKGGVSLNGYTYPTSLGVSQFLFYNGDATGVSGIKIVSPDSSIDIQYAPGLLAIAATGGGGGGGATSIDNLTDARADGVVGNIFLGYKPTITPGAANNIAIGVSAMFHEDLGQISGSNNIAVGSNALLQAINDTTNDNIAIGYSTLISTDIISSQNVAIGTSALTAATGTSQNVAIGYIAGKEIITGYQNTIVGASAGITLTTGNNNVILGYGAEPASVNSSNNVYLGNTSMSNLYFSGNIIATSDARDKTDVEDSAYGVEFIDRLRPVEYTWNRRHLQPGDDNDNINGKRRVGLIAQELLEIMPDNENEVLNLVNEDNPERYHVGYNNLIPILVKAVKDLKAEVDTLKQRMDACSC